jgi:hypothetical protein
MDKPNKFKQACLSGDIETIRRLYCGYYSLEKGFKYVCQGGLVIFQPSSS